ncbi:MAG TPA: hypothetical protein VG938_10530 [Verrucomicrobiae bacterium]|nr:hypothetical protein [Verrucomicrobiae bacterium]
MVSLALIYVGGSVGEGPSYAENVFSVGLASAGFFVFWTALEIGGRVSVSIAEERDLASGIRLSGFLLSIGLVLGRAVAGDWHSASETIRDFIQDGWPAVVLCLVAVTIERFMRPNRQHPFRTWPKYGLLPVLVYMVLAGAWLLHLGAWEGMHQ